MDKSLPRIKTDCMIETLDILSMHCKEFVDVEIKDLLVKFWSKCNLNVTDEKVSEYLNTICTNTMTSLSKSLLSNKDENKRMTEMDEFVMARPKRTNFKKVFPLMEGDHLDKLAAEKYNDSLKESLKEIDETVANLEKEIKGRSTSLKEDYDAMVKMRTKMEKISFET